jgi:CheY-like chemotaxis protein
MPHRILIANEDPNLRALHRSMAERLGLIVVEAADGRGAAKLALATRPDLVLLDLLMPGLDGIETTRRIREEERRAGHRRSTPVIVMAAPQQETRTRAIAAGASGVVPKPLNSVALKALLCRYFSDWEFPEPESGGGSEGAGRA